MEQKHGHQQSTCPHQSHCYGTVNKSTVLDRHVYYLPLLHRNSLLHFNGVGILLAFWKTRVGFCEDGQQANPKRTEKWLEQVNTAVASQNTSQTPGNSDVLKIRVLPAFVPSLQPLFLGHP